MLNHLFDKIAKREGFLKEVDKIATRKGFLKGVTGESEANPPGIATIYSPDDPVAPGRYSIYAMQIDDPQAQPPKGAFDVLVFADSVGHACFFGRSRFRKGLSRIKKAVCAAKPGGRTYVAEYSDRFSDWAISLSSWGAVSSPFEPESDRHSPEAKYKHFLSAAGCETRTDWLYQEFDRCGEGELLVPMEGGTKGTCS